MVINLSLIPEFSLTLPRIPRKCVSSGVCVLPAENVPESSRAATRRANKVLIDFLAGQRWRRIEDGDDTVGKMNGNFCHKNDLLDGRCRCLAQRQNLRPERILRLRREQNMGAGQGAIGPRARAVCNPGLPIPTRERF